MAITSQIREPLLIGEAILQDWEKAGLAKPSLLKPLIATIEQNQITKLLGSLSVIDKGNLQRVIHSILEYAVE
ncbi:toxin-antitoxin system, toxin component, MazF family protein [Leptospira sp. WS92.C1]